MTAASTDRPPAGGQAVLFDFGGVLFRWQPTLLIQQVMPALAPDEAAARRVAELVFQGFRVDGDWAGFDRGSIEPDALAAAIARRSGLPAPDVRRLIDAVPPHLQLQQPTLALIRRLRAAGHRLAFLSNMPEPYAQALERLHPFAEWFEAGVFSARVGLVKPEPAIFAHAAATLGLEPARTLFIDDHAPNIASAAALGWQTLHFTTPEAAAERLAASGWF